LNAGGLFIANLDLDSIKIEGENDVRYLKDTFRKNGMTYNARTKILSCREPKMMDFGLHYQGANDKAGPNYTGQEAVNSHYKILATL
jgi:hypothetical protein